MMRFILLRGLGRDQAHWGRFVDQLQADFPEAHILTPDLPGAGVLCKETSPLSLDDYIPRIESQLPTLDEKDQNILVGLSLGGMLALHWLAKSPLLFQRVVAINSSAGQNAVNLRLNLNALFRSAPKYLCSTVREKERFIYRLTCNKKDMPPGLLDTWVAIQTSRPVRPHNQARQIVAASRFQLTLDKSIGPKLLILCSSADRLVRYECSQYIAHTLHAEIRVHDWGGHDLTQDDPEWVSAAIKDNIYEAPSEE